MLHSVFVSYSRADLDRVDEVVAVLESLRVPIWVDRRDIPVSVPWFDEVQAAIEAAALLVVCDSPRWRASEACRLEHGVARKECKAVLTVDIAAPAPVVVRQIAEAYYALSPQQRAHTEVMARAAMWRRQDRTPSRLIAGALLAQARRLMRGGTPPLSPTAREFVVASARRQRRRRWLASGGIAVGLVVTLVCCLGVSLAGLLQDQLDVNDVYFHESVADAHVAGATVYDEITLAAQRVEEGRRGWLNRQALARALSEQVPDISFQAPQRLVGLAGTATKPTGIGADGRYYVEGGPDRSVKPLTTGKVTAAVTSRDGTVAAVSGSHALIRGDGKTVRAASADQVAFSPDGRTVLTAGGGMVRLLRPDGAVRATGPAPVGCCTSLATANDWAVFGLRDGTLNRWRPGDRQAVIWKSPKGAVSGITVSPDGRFVAVTVANDGLVRVFDVTGRQFRPHRTLPVPAAAGPASFSPDGRLLAVGANDSVAVFDVRSGLRISLLRGSIGAVRNVAWSSNGERVSVLAGERRLSSWRWRAGTVVADEPRRIFVALTGARDANSLSAVDSAGQVSTMDGHSAQVSGFFAVDTSGVVSADASRDGSVIVLGGDGHLAVRDLRDDREKRFSTDGCSIIDVAVDDEGRVAFVACLDGGVRAYDLVSGKLTHSGDVVQRQEISIALGADGTVFAGNGTGEIHAFTADLKSAKRLVEPTCRLPVRRLAVGASGDLVVMAGDGASHLSCSYEARRHDGVWQRDLFQQPPGDGELARAVALADDESLAAIGFSDGRVHIWRPGDLETVGLYHQFGGEVRALKFTSDGRKLLVATADGIVQIVPACPLCGDADQLAAQARELLDAAVAKGLHVR